MKLTPPKAITFWISVLLVVVGAVSMTVNIPFVSNYSLAVIIIGYVLLALGNMIKKF